MTLYQSAQRSARRAFLVVMLFPFATLALMALTTLRPQPVEWRCAIEQTSFGILHFQARTFGDSLRWAYLDSKENADTGVRLNRLHDDGDRYAMLDLTLRYALPADFWVDIAAWDGDTILVRVSVPDTSGTCEVL